MSISREWFYDWSERENEIQTNTIRTFIKKKLFNGNIYDVDGIYLSRRNVFLYYLRKLRLS